MITFFQRYSAGYLNNNRDHIYSFPGTKQYKPSTKESLYRLKEAPQPGTGEAEPVKLNRWGCEGNQAVRQTPEMTNHKTEHDWLEMNMFRYYKTERESSRKQIRAINGSKDRS